MLFNHNLYHLIRDISILFTPMSLTLTLMFVKVITLVSKFPQQRGNLLTLKGKGLLLYFKIFSRIMLHNTFKFL
jgi:hypothetical protein